MKQTVINRNKESDERQADKFMQSVVVIAKTVPMKSYSMSLTTKLRDIGVATVGFFSQKPGFDSKLALQELMNLKRGIHQRKEHEAVAAIAKIEDKYDTHCEFVYPVMNVLKTNSHMLAKLDLTMELAQQKFDRFMAHQAYLKSKMTHNPRKIKQIDAVITNQLNKFKLQMAIYRREEFNRRAWCNLSADMKVHNSFNLFMQDINGLSQKQKETLLRLITIEERLSPKHFRQATPYQLMFALQKGSSEFIVGLRCNYDLFHPHPTLMGGNSPQVIIAGTIDLKLNGNTLMVKKIRLDSGHYMPDSDSLEIVLKYIKSKVNPDYFDTLTVHTFEGDSKTPELEVKKRALLTI